MFGAGVAGGGFGAGDAAAGAGGAWTGGGGGTTRTGTGAGDGAGGGDLGKDGVVVAFTSGVGTTLLMTLEDKKLIKSGFF